MEPDGTGWGISCRAETLPEAKGMIFMASRVFKSGVSYGVLRPWQGRFPVLWALWGSTWVPLPGLQVGTKGTVSKWAGQGFRRLLQADLDHRLPQECSGRHRGLPTVL